MVWKQIVNLFLEICDLLSNPHDDNSYLTLRRIDAYLNVWLNGSRALVWCSLGEVLRRRARLEKKLCKKESSYL